MFKSKVFFVQKQRFFCSKAKICSKVERFVLQKFFQIKISFKYRSCFFKSCVFFILNFLSFRYRSCFLKAFSFRYRSLFQMLIYFFFKFQFVFLLAAWVQTVLILARACISTFSVDSYISKILACSWSLVLYRISFEYHSPTLSKTNTA